MFWWIATTFIHKSEYTLINTHLILPDHPHATATSPIRCFENDGEAVDLGKLLSLL